MIENSISRSLNELLGRSGIGEHAVTVDQTRMIIHVSQVFEVMPRVGILEPDDVIQLERSVSRRFNFAHDIFHPRRFGIRTAAEVDSLGAGDTVHDPDKVTKDGNLVVDWDIVNNIVGGIERG